MTRHVASKPELVPSPYFLDIPAHVKMIQTLLREWWVGGERAFLLLGNQGTGTLVGMHIISILFVIKKAAHR